MNQPDPTQGSTEQRPRRPDAHSALPNAAGTEGVLAGLPSELFRWSQPRLVILLLTLAILAAFWPVLVSDFITFDDPAYVTSNPIVRQGVTLQGLWWAFT